MAAHGMKRARPAELLPGTVSVITVAMNYLPRGGSAHWREQEGQRLAQPDAALVSLYARGRDYHKVLRQRLQRLADRLQQQLGPLGVRAFTDSAPVLEVELATRSGVGWRGRHTLALRRDAGSMFFLGELFINRALPPTEPVADHCGTCTACVQHCPTQAIVALAPAAPGPAPLPVPDPAPAGDPMPSPTVASQARYTVDARRCISYLTIEHAGAIAPALRPAIGNHLYGCDDCQLACPWNKFAQPAVLADFDARPGLAQMTAAEALAWSENEFLHHTEGTPIRRIGHERWLRNAAVVAGNTLAAGVAVPAAAEIRRLLALLLAHHSPLVREHAQWALARGEAQGVGAQTAVRSPAPG